MITKKRPHAEDKPCRCLVCTADRIEYAWHEWVRFLLWRRAN